MHSIDCTIHYYSSSNCNLFWHKLRVQFVSLKILKIKKRETHLSRVLSHYLEACTTLTHLGRLAKYAFLDGTLSVQEIDKGCVYRQADLERIARSTMLGEISKF